MCCKYGLITLTIYDVYCFCELVIYKGNISLTLIFYQTKKYSMMLHRPLWIVKAELSEPEFYGDLVY